jgi:filamentous hemagglutinin family protein
MNKVYSVVWNYSLQTWTVASEKASSRGKRKNSGKRAIGAIASAVLSPVIFAAPPAPNELPTNGQVVAGQIGISQTQNSMNIHQQSQNGIINWQSFNVGSEATVNFKQPNSNSATLNRVTSGGASQILGQMKANGQVFVVNPNGVIFGKNAQVDVGGLVASSLDIKNEDFMAGKYDFAGDASGGAVINQGEILARYVALLAPEVLNEGVVIARQGTVALAAGQAITLSISGEQLVDVQVSKAQYDTLVENRHLIEVNDGLVILAAQSAANLLGQTVNTGAIAAGGIVNEGGVVRLTASSQVTHTGSINVDAGVNGKGGEAILLANLDNPNSRTDVSGSISARGGSKSGDGGFIETSASKVKIAETTSIDTRAAHGRSGDWLIDPTDFTVGIEGDIRASTLETQLASSNVTIESVNGAAEGNGDIFVNESISWDSNELTLTADRNIEINATLDVTSGGGLNLKFGQSGSASDFLNFGDYSINAPVNLASGTRFTTTFGNDGLTINYTVITNEAGLLAVDSDMTGNYVLGSDISVSTNPWNPLGNAAGDFAFGTTGFTGIFDGLGHDIDGLTRANTTNSTGIGLFGQIGDQFTPGGLVQNLGITNVNLAGLSEVGALAGANFGIVNNVHSTGTVTGGDAVGPTNDDIVAGVGGLIGTNGGLIRQSYSSVTVSATTGDQSFGDGLDGGTGGLVGSNIGGSIDSSYATGDVTGNRDVGGLVGYVDGTISSSYSSGAVSGSTNVGGLVGDLFFMAPFGAISDSFWNTTTSGIGVSAGGTGLTNTQAQQQSSYTGFDFTNTWVMYDGISQPLLQTMLTPYYVSVNDQTKTYDGTVFTGFTANESESVRPSVITGTLIFSGSGTTAINAGTYTVSASGLSLTNAGKLDQQGYIIKYVDGTMTIEQALLTVTAWDQDKTYGDLLSLNTSAFNVTGLVGADTIGSVSITSASGNASNTRANAGTYADDLEISNATGGSFNASNYAISYVAGDLVIDPRTLTVTANDQIKTYGDELSGSSTEFSTSGLVNGDTVDAVRISGTNASNTGANVGTYTNDLVASNASGSDFNPDNYDINYVNGDLTINPAQLTVTADDQSITEGDEIPALTQTITGFVNGESLATSDVTGSGVASTGATIESPAGNYDITSGVGSLASSNYLFTFVNGLLAIRPQVASQVETAVEIVQQTLNNTGGRGNNVVTNTGSFPTFGDNNETTGSQSGSEYDAVQRGAGQFCDNCITVEDPNAPDVGVKALQAQVEQTQRAAEQAKKNTIAVSGEVEQAKQAVKLALREAQLDPNSKEKADALRKANQQLAESERKLAATTAEQYAVVTAAERKKRELEINTDGIAGPKGRLKEIKQALQDKMAGIVVVIKAYGRIGAKDTRSEEEKSQDQLALKKAEEGNQLLEGLKGRTKELYEQLDKLQQQAWTQDNLLKEEQKSVDAVKSKLADASEKAMASAKAAKKAADEAAADPTSISKGLKAKQLALQASQDKLSETQIKSEVADAETQLTEKETVRNEAYNQVKLTESALVQHFTEEDKKAADTQLQKTAFDAISNAVASGMAAKKADASETVAQVNEHKAEANDAAQKAAQIANRPSDYADRAAIKAQLKHLQRLMPSVVSYQEKLKIEGEHPEFAKRGLANLNTTLDNFDDLDTETLKQKLEEIKSQAQQGLSRSADFATYVDQHKNPELKAYSGASHYLQVGLVPSTLNEIGARAADEEAQKQLVAREKSAKLAEETAKLAADAAAKAEESLRLLGNGSGAEADKLRAEAKQLREEAILAQQRSKQAVADFAVAQQKAKEAKQNLAVALYEKRKTELEVAENVNSNAQRELKYYEAQVTQNENLVKVTEQEAAEAKAQATEAAKLPAKIKADQDKWKAFSKEKETQITGLEEKSAKAVEEAKTKLEAAKALDREWLALNAEIEKELPGVKAIQQEKYDAEVAYYKAKKAREKLAFSGIKGGLGDFGEAFQLATSIYDEVKKSEQKPQAQAALMAAEDKLNKLRKEEPEKVNAINAKIQRANELATRAQKAYEEANTAEIARVDALNATALAKAEKAAADQTASNLDAKIAQAEQYSTDMQTYADGFESRVAYAKGKVEGAKQVVESAKETALKAGKEYADAKAALRDAKTELAKQQAAESETA